MPSLLDDLKHLDDLYYNQGNSSLSDLEYDLFRNKVKILYPNDPYFKTVGVSSKKKTVKIPVTMGSLEKKKIDSIESWLKGKSNFVISDKLDGLSIFVEFNEGILTFASTRGDGIYGTCITEKIAKKFPSIYYKDKIQLRGEITLRGDSYLKYGFKNRRNGAVGIVNRDDMIGVEDLEIYFYELIP